MTKHALLFDANAIYKLIRDLPDDAPDKLMDESTIPLSILRTGKHLVEGMFFAEEDKRRRS